MKRIGLSVFVIGTACLLTGCFGGKTLTCTQTEDEGGATLSSTVKLKFDSKDEFTKGSANYQFKIEEDYLDYFDTFKDYLKEEFEESEEFKDLNVQMKDNGKDTFTINFDIDRNYLEEEEDATSYSDVKASLEDSGYTCK